MIEYTNSLERSRCYLPTAMRLGKCGLHCIVVIPASKLFKSSAWGRMREVMFGTDLEFVKVDRVESSRTSQAFSFKSSPPKRTVEHAVMAYMCLTYRNSICLCPSNSKLRSMVHSRVQASSWSQSFLRCRDGQRGTSVHRTMIRLVDLGWTTC